MDKQFRVYKGEVLVGTYNANDEGQTSFDVKGLKTGEYYPEGTYEISLVNESGESDRVPVPAFTVPVPTLTVYSSYQEDKEQEEPKEDKNIKNHPRDYKNRK